MPALARQKPENARERKTRSGPGLVWVILSFDIRICFDIRISVFGFCLDVTFRSGTLISS